MHDYRKEFPDFPEADMPALPEGFEDMSWHNDACPSFQHEAKGLCLWIDYADPAMSEMPEARAKGELKRFSLIQMDPDEEHGWQMPACDIHALVAESDDIDDILLAVGQFQRPAA